MKLRQYFKKQNSLDMKFEYKNRLKRFKMFFLVNT